MIYSKEINKICALCCMARNDGDDEIFCEKKKKNFPSNTEACKKFSYDILKRPVRRMRRIKTSYNKEDFTL